MVPVFSQKTYNTKRIFSEAANFTKEMVGTFQQKLAERISRDIFESQIFNTDETGLFVSFVYKYTTIPK